MIPETSHNKPENDLNSHSQELQRARRELDILYQVSNAMRTTLDLRHILYIILTGVTSHEGLGFNRAILFLVNSATRSLEPKMALGPESLEDAWKIWQQISQTDQHLDDLIREEKVDQNIGQKALFNSVKELQIPLSVSGNNLLNTAFGTGSPVHISPDRITQFADDPLLKAFKTTELVIMPLKVKDHVNGLIIADNLYTQKPISSDDLKIFSMLADQAALAIENSRLFEMTKHKSHTDALTGLWNHGFFQNKLTEEIDDARETKQSVGLMMIDIDDFKQLNDRFGHQSGDIVLKEIAKILKDSSREFDFACRYGGEEFAIILTETNNDQSFAVAERIREKVAQHTFPALPDGQLGTITVSIGLALFPSDEIQSKENLIAQADKAMYTAKFSGKNQTRTAATSSA